MNMAETALSKILGLVGSYAPAMAATVLNPAAGGAILITKILRDVTGAGADADPEDLAAQILGNPELQVKLRIAAMDHELALAHETTERLRVDALDRDSARTREMTYVKATGKRDEIAGFVAIATVSGFLVLCILLASGIGKGMFSENPAILILFGALSAGFGQVLQYFFGSSDGSRTKTDLLAEKGK
jgi:hypothetical protein